VEDAARAREIREIEPRESQDDEGRRRRRRAESQQARLRHRRMRFIFFGIAALWGFTLGCIVLFAGLAVSEPTFRLGAGLAILLLLAAIVAVAGGQFVAIAYRLSLGRMTSPTRRSSSHRSFARRG
jgi:hypothetical protein